MDTSPEFVKMCEEFYKTTQISPSIIFCPKCKKLDFDPDCQFQEAKIYGGKKGELIHTPCDTSYKPIYPQDQLQAMVINQYTPAELLWILQEWVGIHSLHHSHKFPSMEQLWLAYVMHKKYQKHWNPQTKT